MNTKYRMESFALYDYQGVERHLEKMEARGWRLERTGTFWKYQRVEPRQVHYAATYVPEASDFNPVPTRGQEELRELCAAAGWEKVGDWFQMQIFRSEQSDPYPLETEDAVRLAVLRRAGRKNFVPSGILLMALALLMMVMQISTLLGDPVTILSQTSRMLPILLWLLVFLSVAGNLLDYALWLRRSERSVAQGGPCVPGGGYRRLSQVTRGLFAVLTVGYAVAFVTEGETRMLPFILAYLAGFALLALLVRGTKQGLMRRGVGKRTNMALTLSADVLGAVVLVGGFTFLIFWGVTQQGWFRSEPADVYKTENFTFELYRDALPLTVEDLTGRTGEHYSYERTEHSSPLLGYLEGRQWHAPDGSDALELEYEVVTVKASFLYDWCLSTYLRQYTEDTEIWIREYRPEDPAPWGAQAAYRLWRDGEAYNRWLLCWEDRIVELDADWALTEQQQEIAAEKLTDSMKTIK